MVARSVPNTAQRSDFFADVISNDRFLYQSVSYTPGKFRNDLGGMISYLKRRRRISQSLETTPAVHNQRPSHIAQLQSKRNWLFDVLSTVGLHGGFPVVEYHELRRRGRGRFLSASRWTADLDRESDLWYRRIASIAATLDDIKDEVRGNLDDVCGHSHQ